MSEVSPELSLRFQSARTSPDTSSIESLALDIDWPEIFEPARWHAVQPLVTSALEACELPESTEESLRELKDEVRNNGLAVACLSLELTSIVKWMRAGGLECVLFKGAAASVLAYGEVWRRVFADNDILVRPSEMMRATEMLGEFGYRTTPPLSDRQANLQVRRAPFAYFFSLDREDTWMGPTCIGGSLSRLIPHSQSS